MKKIIKAGIEELNKYAYVKTWLGILLMRVLKAMLAEAEKSRENPMNIHTRIERLELKIKEQNAKINTLEEKSGSSVMADINYLMVRVQELKNAVKSEGTIFTAIRAIEDKFADLEKWKSDLLNIHQSLAKLEKPVVDVKDEDWKPKVGEVYYFIASSLYIICTKNYNVNSERINSGNCFRTKEQAEQALERVKRAIKGE